MGMKDSISDYGALELNLLNAALADLAHFYCWGCFVSTVPPMRKHWDAQAETEYALFLDFAMLNGCSIIHDCGYPEAAFTSSFESILFADEIIDMVK